MTYSLKKKILLNLFHKHGIIKFKCRRGFPPVGNIPGYEFYGFKFWHWYWFDFQNYLENSAGVFSFLGKSIYFWIPDSFAERSPILIDNPESMKLLVKIFDQNVRFTDSTLVLPIHLKIIDLDNFSWERAAIEMDLGF